MMNWDIEYTDEFRAWWDTLSEAQQNDVAASVTLLREQGPTLRFPHSSGIEGSKHAHMRELRVQSGGHPLRIFYAFDPRRAAILLIGGDKTGIDFMRHISQLQTSSTILTSTSFEERG
jgi:hypothetical protein